VTRPRHTTLEVRVPRWTHHRLMVAARVTDEDIEQIVTEALREYLDRIQYQADWSRP
jgi:predicted HicB family RNase H-like nuclease